MNKNNEKTVFGMRIPKCAKVKDVKYSRELGVVAMTMECNGNAVTFFRTDFLTPIERVAWDDTEVFSEKCFHEDIPEHVLKSITNTGGIFIACDFVKTRDGVLKRKMSQEQASKISTSIKIPEMEANLIYGAVYDMIGRWLIVTGSLTEEEWVYSPETKETQASILDRFCGNWTIRELFGNIFETEWTLENYSDSVVAREGIPHFDGEAHYPARKRYTYSASMIHPYAVARVMWSFK